MFTLSSPRRWAVVAVAAALLMAALGWFFLISPQRAQISQDRAQAAVAQTRALALHSTLDRLRADNATLPDLTVALAALHKALPDSADTAGLLAELQRAGSGTGVAVTSLTVGAPVTPGTSTATTTGVVTASTPLALPVTLVAAGSPTRLASFLRAMQTDEPRAVVVQQVSQSAGPKGSSTLTVNLQIFLDASS